MRELRLKKNSRPTGVHRRATLQPTAPRQRLRPRPGVGAARGGAQWRAGGAGGACLQPHGQAGRGGESQRVESM